LICIEVQTMTKFDNINNNDFSSNKIVVIQKLSILDTSILATFIETSPLLILLFFIRNNVFSIFRLS